MICKHFCLHFSEGLVENPHLYTNVHVYTFVEFDNIIVRM
jgi:hypothetical protein